jgi:hypothetical protein
MQRNSVRRAYLAVAASVVMLACSGKDDGADDAAGSVTSSSDSGSSGGASTGLATSTTAGFGTSTTAAETSTGATTSVEDVDPCPTFSTEVDCVAYFVGGLPGAPNAHCQWVSVYRGPSCEAATESVQERCVMFGGRVTSGCAPGDTTCNDGPSLITYREVEGELEVHGRQGLQGRPAVL